MWSVTFTILSFFFFLNLRLQKPMLILHLQPISVHTGFISSVQWLEVPNSYCIVCDRTQVPVISWDQGRSVQHLFGPSPCCLFVSFLSSASLLQVYLLVWFLFSFLPPLSLLSLLPSSLLYMFGAGMNPESYVCQAQILSWVASKIRSLNFQPEDVGSLATALGETIQ